MTNVTGDTVQAWDILTAKLTTWGQDAVAALPNLMVATLAMVGFWLLARAAARVSERILAHTSESYTVNGLIVTTTRTVVLFFGLFTTLGILNLDKTVASLLAGAGVIGLAIGFAFQEIAANFFSGILIAIRKPYREGDFVKIESFAGVVSAVTLRTTNLTTTDGLLVLVPNKDMFTKAVTNYTSTPDRLVQITVGVSYSADLRKVEAVARQAVEKIEGRIEGRETSFSYKEFGDSSINFQIGFWIQFRQPRDYSRATHLGIMAIKEAFDQNQISIPFPTRTLEITKGDAENL